MIDINTMIEQARILWCSAVGIWDAGGWCMPVLATLAMAMFALGMHLHFKLGEKGFLSIRERTWRSWIDHPSQRRGPVGEMLDLVTGGRSTKDTATFFKELRITEIAAFSRDLKIMKICVGAAPLVGLLGTVTGMLSTFAALSHGSGGDKTMGMVAEGISEALITTETGLVIALPGLFFQYLLASKHDRYKAFLAHVESACMQVTHKRVRREQQDRDQDPKQDQGQGQQQDRSRPREGVYISERRPAVVANADDEIVAYS